MDRIVLRQGLVASSIRMNLGPLLVGAPEQPALC